MNYIFGKVAWTNKKSIIIENNGVGFKVNINNTKSYIVEKVAKIYIYRLIKIDHKNNLNEEYYGFSQSMERNLFSDLLTINGIGAITAFNILSNNVDDLIAYIANGDIESLKLLNGINAKNAIAIINTLTDKYKKIYTLSGKEMQRKNKLNSELIFALKKLGYKNDDIYSLSSLEFAENEDISESISKSIKFIAQRNEQQNAN